MGVRDDMTAVHGASIEEHMRMHGFGSHPLIDIRDSSGLHGLVVFVYGVGSNGLGPHRDLAILASPRLPSFRFRQQGKHSSIGNRIAA
ncbi:hypothetical protein F2Q68_00043266 [Brassica cretica]|uniref:Uncharacterized protein n=1 Tax=Brassica cretica TaxID=69181 RepID=A0A8S9LI00_BRACR|nr:hypothetical protein F2Q68_00043266 [Brassica cretica]